MENSESTAVEEKSTVAVIEQAVQEAEEQQKVDGAPGSAESGDVPAAPAAPAAPEAELSQEEINWRVVRQKREEDKRAKEEAQSQSMQKDSQIKDLTDALQNVLQSKDSPNLSQKQQDKIISELIDEDIPTGGEVKDFINRVVPDIVNKIMGQNEKQRLEEKVKNDRKELPNNLKKRHSDFKETVHDENLMYLDVHYPEISNALSQLPEGIEKWSSIYGTIKKLVPNVGKGDSRRLDNNSKKPQAMTATSAPPSKEKGHSRQLSTSEKEANYKRLIELAKGA